MLMFLDADVSKNEFVYPKRYWGEDFNFNSLFDFKYPGVYVSSLFKIIEDDAD